MQIGTLTQYRPISGVVQPSFCAAKNPNHLDITEFSKLHNVSEGVVRYLIRQGAIGSASPSPSSSILRVNLDSASTKRFLEKLATEPPEYCTGEDILKGLGIDASNAGDLTKFLRKEGVMSVTNVQATHVAVFHLFNPDLKPACDRYLARYNEAMQTGLFSDGNISGYCKYPKKWVSSKILVESGYGSAKDLLEGVKERGLAGKIEDTGKTNEQGRPIKRLLIDVSDPQTTEILADMRKNNPDVLKPSALAKKLGIPTASVGSLINMGVLRLVENTYENGELQPLINCNLSVNREAIEAITSGKLPIQGSSGSIKMHVAWELCSFTKSAMASLAKEKGNRYAAYLYSKEKSKERLSTREQIVVNNFRQQIWNSPGTKEAWSKALTEAGRLVKLVQERGISAVESMHLSDAVIGYLKQLSSYEAQ